MGIIIDDDGVMHKVFTKADMVNMLEELMSEIEEMPMHYDPRDVNDLIQQKINELKQIKDYDVKPIEATPQLSEADSKKIIKEISTKPNYKRVQKLKEIVKIELPTENQ